MVLLSDCPKSKKAAESTPFQLSKLQKLVLDYNACVSGVADQRSSYAKSIEKVKWVVGVVGGLLLTKIKFIGNSLDNVDFTTSQNPILGPSLEIVLPRRRRQYSFYNELLYRPYRVSTPNSVRPSQGRLFLEMAYLKLITTFRWHYPSGQLRPYANIGFGNAFAIKKAKTNLLPETRGYEQSLVGGAGISFRRLGAELRYEVGNGISPYSTLKSTTRTVYLLVGYQF